MRCLWFGAALIAALSSVSPIAAGARAQEVGEVRLAQQFGIAYLPMVVMKEKHLLEERVRAAGLPEPKVTWATFSSSAGMNDALLSGNLDVASGGVGPLVTLWARTLSSIKVRGIATLGSTPIDLTTNRAEIHGLKDFTDQDRIALPAVGVSVQAVMLQMAAEQAFGAGQHKKLDPLTVSLSHPDGVAALLSGRLEVTGHFSSPPFQQQELADPRIHRVLSSYDVLGGPHSFNVVWCTTKFHDTNPKTAVAILGALDAAMDFIKADPDAATTLYLASEKSNLRREFVRSLITAPENRYTTVPENVMKFAAFQFRTGLVKEQAHDWRDLFFPALHNRPGS